MRNVGHPALESWDIGTPCNIYTNESKERDGPVRACGLPNGWSVAVSKPVAIGVESTSAAPTESHALAVTDHEEKGAAETTHGGT
ncbi:unnamed protein product [Tuber aestivum]|uniref:Uncharacterized protein n=1 Tax=Tuber aestivum TaxID=59557 RepID=A0A292PUA1_9PEZI|nr:unnamed protein product [Tuber aestivum]